MTITLGLINGQLHEELWLSTDPELNRAIDYAKVQETDRQVRDCVGGDLQASNDREFAKLPEFARRQMDPTGQREKTRLTRAVQSSAEYSSLMREGLPLPVELNALERRDIPAAELEPPNGFRPASPDEVMGAAR